MRAFVNLHEVQRAQTTRQRVQPGSCLAAASAQQGVFASVVRPAQPANVLPAPEVDVALLGCSFA